MYITSDTNLACTEQARTRYDYSNAKIIKAKHGRKQQLVEEKLKISQRRM